MRRRSRTKGRAAKRTTKREKKRTRVHDVQASLSVPKLAKAGSSLTLEIFARNEKVGEIIIGRGSLHWYGRKRKIKKRISWSRFANMMDELAYG